MSCNIVQVSLPGLRPGLELGVLRIFAWTQQGLLILVYVGVRENTQLFCIHTMYCSLIACTDRSAYLHICVRNV